MLERTLLLFVQYAVYAFVMFCIAVGATYEFVNNTDARRLSTTARLVSQVAAFLVTGIVAMYALNELKLNIYLVSLLGLFGGMGADKVLRLCLKLYNDSTSLADFFKRFWAAYNAARGSGPRLPPDEFLH